MKKETAIQCIGFIMDGNRRWARDQGLPTCEGHRKGGDVLSESMQWVRDAGIPHAVYYAFSTENWKRSDEEVGYLMGLFREWLQKIEERILEEQTEDEAQEPIKVRIIGQREDFAEDIQGQMNRLEKMSHERERAKTTIWIALSYGGRAEITEAVNEAVRRGEEVSEGSFEQLLWTAGMPDPDIIVRTSGEHRLSNFMTWKSVYSEFLFLDKHWPALTKKDFEDILTEYESRDRRKGK
jgi:undecaprenyl diphosphate synthase